MTSPNAIPDGDPSRSGTNAGPSGPFVGIDLPTPLAAQLAGSRPVLSLDHTEIPNAGLSQMENAEVGCLLLGETVDAMDIIADLYAAGYRGTVTVVTPPMPDPRMIERELASAAKPMTVKLVVR